MQDRRVVLITGCSSGFGYLTALKFAREGDCVYATVRNTQSDGAKELQKIASDEKLSLTVSYLDVTKQDSIDAATNEIIKQRGRIDILVNNAGFGYVGPVEDFAIDEIMDQHNTNVLGMLRMVQAVLPLMQAQKGGLIINISSINGLIPFPFYGVYSSSKFAVETLSEALSIELASCGIKVSLVEPGSFLTNFQKNELVPARLKAGESRHIRTFARFREFYNEKKVTDSWFVKFINPQRVADTIYQISKEEKPKLRHIVGFDAKFYYLLRRIVPYRTWEWIVRKVYNL